MTTTKMSLLHDNRKMSLLETKLRNIVQIEQ